MGGQWTSPQHPTFQSAKGFCLVQLLHPIRESPLLASPVHLCSSGRCTASPLESRYSGCPSGQGKAVLRKSPTPLPRGWLRPRLHLRCLPLCATFHTFQGTSGPWWIRTEAGSSVRDLITLCHPLLQHSQRGFLDCKFPTSDVQLLTLTDRKLRATMKRQVASQTVLLRSILTGDILLWVV